MCFLISTLIVAVAAFEQSSVAVTSTSAMQFRLGPLQLMLATLGALTVSVPQSSDALTA